MNSIPITLEALAARITELEKAKGDNHADHSNIYRRLETLETDKGRTAEQYKYIRRDLDELKKQQQEILDRIELISQKPAKRWDTVVTSTITAIIGGIIGFILTRVLGGE